VPQNVLDKEKLTESMFCSSYGPEVVKELGKYLRVMPHHQNTSGFFITIFEKVKEIGKRPGEPASIERPLPSLIQEMKDGK